MGDWWYFWSQQEWYWSALSFFSFFFIILVMVCLCWKFFHTGHDDDDEGRVIVSRDPAPSLIILHAQTPSENEKILRRYGSLRSKSYEQPQFYFHSPGGGVGQQVSYNSLGGAAGQNPHSHYNCSESQTSTDPRPPPYAPNY